MKKHSIQKTLLATAIVLGMGYVQAAAPTSTALSSPAGASQVLSADAQQVKEEVQQWVNGFQTAFPFYAFTLKDFQNQGDRSLATIEVTLGTPSSEIASEFSSSNFYATFETKVSIDRGLTLSAPHVGLAQIGWESVLTDNSSPELITLIGTQPLDRTQGVVTLTGDLDVAFKSVAPFVRKIDELKINIPSYSGTFQSYNQAQLGRLEMAIPSIAFNDSTYNKNHSVQITNLHLLQNDKPIRNDLYDLNGHTQVTVEKITLVEGKETYLTLNNFKYTEDGKIDAQRLYQAQFASSASGVTNEPGSNHKPITFSFDVSGAITNLHADSYVKLINLIDNPDSDFDDEAIQNAAFDLLSHAPSFSMDKMTIILNGHQGNLSYSASLAPISANEREIQFYLLLMQKLQINATMDIPVEWVNIFWNDDDQQDTDAVLSKLESEGYINRKGGRITSNFVYQMGNMTVNGKPVGSGGFPF